MQCSGVSWLIIKPSKLITLRYKNCLGKAFFSWANLIAQVCNWVSWVEPLTWHRRLRRFSYSTFYCINQADGFVVQTEELVARYTYLRWNKHTIPMIYDRLDALSPTRRQVLLIRLANKLEDHLDLGILYCGNPQQRREYVQSSRYQCVEITHQLGFSDLAVELEYAFQDALAFQRCDRLTRDELALKSCIHQMIVHSQT